LVTVLRLEVVKIKRRRQYRNSVFKLYGHEVRGFQARFR
jgi:hypothetical protein